MLKVLADENLERGIILFLGTLGMDVRAVTEDFPSATDDEVLKVALDDERIIFTNDKDFGYVVYREQRKHCGIVLLRFVTEKTAEKIALLKEVFSTVDLGSFKKSFVVISEKGVRIRTKPSAN